MQIIISGLVILAMIFIFVLDGDKNKVPLIGRKGKGAKNKDAINKSNKSYKSTQLNLPFKEIKSFGNADDKALIINNNSSYVGVIEVYGVNYNLLSVDEKLLLEEVFQMVLNGIDYPIQIYIQSKRMDIDNYNHIYEERIKDLEGLLKNENNKLSFLNNQPDKEEEIKETMRNIKRLSSQINYGEDVIEFIKQIAYNSDILDKKYYIATTYYYDSSMFNQKQTDDEMFRTAFNTINNRLESVLSGLSRAGLQGKFLNGVELAELIYTSFNKEDYSSYKLKDAMRSGFSNYVITSEPVELKILENEEEKLRKLKEELGA